MAVPTEATVTRPVAEGYSWLLSYGDANSESIYLRGAVGPGREQRIQTVEPTEGVNTAQSAEELRGETGKSFARSDFTGGEGLDRAHRPNAEDRDATRFWDSRNINITPGRAGNPDEIKLLHAAANIRADDAGNSRMPLVRIGTVLYMVCSSQVDVDRTANPTAATPTFTVEDPHAGEGDQDILDLTVLGDEVYAAITTNGIHSRSSAGTWAHWSDLAATRVWGVKGRVIASDGDGLYEAGATTTSTLLHTLPSGQTWTDVVDAGSCIMAGASDGLIYSFAEQEGELVLRQRGRLTDEETITALGFAGGFLFAGTAQATTGGGNIGRLWRAAVIGIKLSGSQVLRQWGEGSTTLNQAPQRIINTREAVYTGVIDSATESHLWKYHLETAGISRDLILNDGLVQGITVVDDRVFATVLVEGLWREATTYPSSGYLISPLADFYTASDKTWIDARLTTGTLSTGVDAVLAYSTDPDAILDDGDASWTTIISADENSQGDLGPTFISEAESRYIAAKLTLTPNVGATATPTVLAFALRGLYKPVEKDFLIPVNISDRSERPGHKARTIPGMGQTILDTLDDIEGKSVTLTDLRSGAVLDGQYRGIQIPIEERALKGSIPTFGLLTIRGVLR